MSNEEAEYYRRQLDQTRRELSECIDEVIFVERARAEAEHRNVASTVRVAALEEEVKILRQQLQTAHLSPQSRSNSQQVHQNFNSPNNYGGAGGGGLVEENASLRGEIAALQAQQLSHTDMTLSNQRTTTARLEQLARQLHGSENEMEMMRRRIEQAEHTERAYSSVVHERNVLEQRVGALEDLLKNKNPQQQQNQQQSPAQQLLAASQALNNSAANGGNNAATTAQLIELRNQVEQMARDANQRQAQVDAAVQRLAASEQQNQQNQQNQQQQFGKATSSSSSLGMSPGVTSINNNNSNDRTRLLAFEKTVQSLNLELASMEQKLREMEALYADQQQRFALARKEFEADQRECDQVVAAMAAELEQLMDDNAKLRQRLRSKTQQAAEHAVAHA